ncbi:tetratricopeptide repeat-containing protein [uncultured Rubinisphaera sp.]|uniref:tetratricopeptide repeat-containing protein n=1 Tax=uncultured Rubinisphaera sp. TaxID=1678686 RepID=UPI0030D99C0F
MVNIAFSGKADRELTQRFARELASDTGYLDNFKQNLTNQLDQLFADADMVFLQEVFEGFRRRDGEMVLHLEVTREGAITPGVIKLGPAATLLEEWEAWQSCKPAGLKHDIVLMDLQRHPADGKLTALVYADAEQLIGVDETLSLETAMLNAVRFGEPHVISVSNLLFQLYERFGILLYRHSYEDDPQERQEPLAADQLDRHLSKNLKLWDDPSGDGLKLRCGVTADLDRKPWDTHFRDPAYFFRTLINHESAQQIVPAMLRGRAHGDLHGRNVLVGKVGHRVLWPAVYDYGDMGVNNLIAWDFVKLEAEFKIRVFPEIFEGKDFTQAIVEFEFQLHEATRKGRDTGNWPSLPEHATQIDRLHWLLLQLRMYAGNHLSYRGRNHLWLKEYTFVLALYGLNSVRFANLTPPQRKWAFLSSGCAAARFLRLKVGVDQLSIPTYRDIIAQAHGWWKTKSPEDLQSSERILKEGLDEHPYAIPLIDELALVLEKQGKEKQAHELLLNAKSQFQAASEETLCRFGKLHKNRAIELIGTNSSPAAIPELEKAELYYGLAYKKSHGHYPRINELAMKFLRAASLKQLDNESESATLLKQVQHDSEHMMKSAEMWQNNHEDDHLWITATHGEAYLLQQQWDASGTAYQKAVELTGGHIRYIEVIYDQVKVLLKACAQMEITPSGLLAQPEQLFNYIHLENNSK